MYVSIYDRRLTKEIYKMNLDGNAAKGRPERTFLDQIEQIVEKGWIKSTQNR
jgi:hypothetical protein